MQKKLLTNYFINRINMLAIKKSYPQADVLYLF